MAFSIDYDRYYDKFDLYLHYKWNVDEQPITSIANQVFNSVLPNINSERITFFNSSIDKHQKYLFLEKEYYDFINMRDNKLVYIYNRNKFHIYLDHLESNKENTTIIVDKSNAFLEVDDFTFQNRDNINIIGKENSLIIIYLKTTSEINSFQNTNINFYNINVMFINENTFDSFKNNKNNFQFNECNIITKDYQILNMDYIETDFNGNYITFNGNDDTDIFNNDNITRVCVLLKDSSNNLLDYKYDNYNNNYNNLFNIFNNNENNKIEIILNDQQVYSYYDSNVYEIDNKFSIDFFDDEYNKKELIDIDINGQGINNIYNWIYNLKDYERLGNGNYYDGTNYFFYNQYITFKVKYINNHIIKSVFSDNEGFSNIINVIYDKTYSDNKVYKINELDPLNRIQTNLVLFNDMFGYIKENTIDKDIILYKYMLNGKNEELIKIIRSYIYNKDDLFNYKNKIPFFKFEQTLQFIYKNNLGEEYIKEININLDEDYYNFYHDYHINISYDNIFNYYINTESNYKDSKYIKSNFNKNILLTNLYEYIKQYNANQITFKLLDSLNNVLFENNINIDLYNKDEYSKYVLYNKDITIMKNNELDAYYNSNFNIVKNNTYSFINLDKYKRKNLLNLLNTNIQNKKENIFKNIDRYVILNNTIIQNYDINMIPKIDFEEPLLLFKSIISLDNLILYRNNHIEYIQNINKYVNNTYDLNLNDLNLNSYNEIVNYLILYGINYMSVEMKNQYFNTIKLNKISNNDKYKILSKTIIYFRKKYFNQISVKHILKDIYLYTKPTIEFINKVMFESKLFDHIETEQRFKNNIYTNIHQFNLFNKTIVKINNFEKYINESEFLFKGYIRQYKPRKPIINIEKYINESEFLFKGYIRTFKNTLQIVNRDKLKNTSIYIYDGYMSQWKPTIRLENKNKYINDGIFELKPFQFLPHSKELKYEFYKAHNLSLDRQTIKLNNRKQENIKNINKLLDNSNLDLINTNLFNTSIIYEYKPLWNMPMLSLKFTPIILKRDDGDYLCVFINSEEQNYIYTLKIPIYELYDLENGEFPLRMSIKYDNSVRIYGIRIEDLSKLGENLLFDNQTTSNEEIYPDDYLSYI